MGQPIKVDYPNWTAVPNALFEILPDLGEAELKVALVIIRETLGWHKRETTISLAEIASIAGLSKGSCCDAAKALSVRGLIKKEVNKGSDGGCSATTYRINFSDTLPPFDQTNAPPPDSEIQHTPHSEIRNAIRNKEIPQDKKEEYTPPTPSEKPPGENYTHRDLINHLNSEGGLIGKGGRAAIEGIDLTDLTFEQAVAKARVEAERPSRPSRKTTGPTRPSRHVTVRTVVVTTPKPEPITPGRDFVAEWNNLVPASPVIAVSAPVFVPAECAANAVFCERFAEVCRAAQKIHEIKGEEVSWLTFRWIIRKKPGEEYGWWRLLTDMRGMSVEPKSNLQRMLDRA